MAVLPRFSLDAARHNLGVELEASDLSEYVSLDFIPVETVPLLDFFWDPDDAAYAQGPIHPAEWRPCQERVLVRPCAVGFWRNPVHDTVHKLAGEMHGTGMRPTSGLFGPSARVAAACRRAAARVGGPYIGVHVRRGDKLELLPGLRAVTNPDAVAWAVSCAAGELRDVYVATNDPGADYAGLLKARGFKVHTRGNLFAEERGSDNHLLFAMEMLLVDEAAVSIRTFNDATPWFFSSQLKPNHFLFDRSMHDYVFGFSVTGATCFHTKPPVDLAALDPEDACAILQRGSAEHHAFLPVDGLPRVRAAEPKAPTCVGISCHVVCTMSLTLYYGSHSSIISHDIVYNII